MDGRVEFMEWIDETCANFSESLASGNATPGGGSASALIGALGVSLGSMAGNLTIGRKAYASVENEMILLCQKAEILRLRLLALVQDDVNAFNTLMESYRLPKETADEEKMRTQIVQERYIAATEVPLNVMDTCAEAFDLLKEFTLKGNKNAISDAACGAIFCKAAAEAASFNVYINARFIDDKDYVQKALNHVETVKEQCARWADEIITATKQQLL